ncbi:MAG TPA: type II secretion system F family protein [Acidothermaceae bacterium]
MSGDQLLGLLAGAGFGLGVWLLICGVQRRELRPRTASRFSVDKRRVGITVAAVVAAAVISRWPVAALGAGALAWYWPRLVGLSSGDRQTIARLDALATWTESLRHTVAGAIGLEQAIPATAFACAPAIRPHLLRLAGQMQARVPMAVALRSLADDLNDPSADLVVAALRLSAQLRGPGLRETLSALATSARAELEMRQKVEAGRKTLRRGAAIIAGVTVVFAGGLTLFNGRYLRPYNSLTGQLMLAVVCAVFGVGFGWLGKLSKQPPQGRIYAPPAGAR